MFQKTDCGQQSLQGAILEVEFPAPVSYPRWYLVEQRWTIPAKTYTKCKFGGKVNNYYFKPLNVSGLLYSNRCLYLWHYIFITKQKGNFLQKYLKNWLSRNRYPSSGNHCLKAWNSGPFLVGWGRRSVCLFYGYDDLGNIDWIYALLKWLLDLFL